MKIPNTEENKLDRLYPGNSKMKEAYIEAEKIEENRRRILLQMIHADFSAEQICDFFEMEPEHLESYTEFLEVDIHSLDEKGNDELFQKMCSLRDETILKAIYDGDEKGLATREASQETLTRFGLYNLPSTAREQLLSSYKEEIRQLTSTLPKKDTTQLYQKIMKKIGTMESTLDHVDLFFKLKRNRNLATDKERELLHKLGFSFEKEKMNRFYNLTVMDNQIEKGESIKGVSRIAELRLEKKLQSIHQEGNTPYSYKSASRREQCFLYYMAGYTQEAIGEKLDITRRTVSTDLRAYRDEFPDRWDKTFLCRRRNTEIQIADEKESIRKTIPSLHYAGMSSKEISALTGLSESDVLRIKIDCNLSSCTAREADFERIQKEERRVLSLLQEGLSFGELCQTLKTSATQVEIHLANLMRNDTPEKFFATYPGRFSELEQMRIQRRYEQLESTDLTWNGMNRRDAARFQGLRFSTVSCRNNEVKKYIRQHPKSLDYMRKTEGKWETFLGAEEQELEL